MKCNFVVGQKVVCIDDNWPEFSFSNDEVGIVPGLERVPMINEILTISFIRVGSTEHTKHAVWLYFRELEGGWGFRHFSPLTERKTDISVFKAMLTPAGRIPVDA